MMKERQLNWTALAWAMIAAVPVTSSLSVWGVSVHFKENKSMADPTTWTPRE
jgi:hypothetical protein